eukprot:9491668-Pyramimonas_sp.AAC.1
MGLSEAVAGVRRKCRNDEELSDRVVYAVGGEAEEVRGGRGTNDRVPNLSEVPARAPPHKSCCSTLAVCTSERGRALVSAPTLAPTQTKNICISFALLSGQTLPGALLKYALRLMPAPMYRAPPRA